MERKDFVSDEEWFFSWYIDELKEAGFIDEAKYQPRSYPLSEEAPMVLRMIKKSKALTITRTLLNAHVYTPDWEISWNDKAKGVFMKNLQSILDRDDPAYFLAYKDETYDMISIVDVKGSANGKNNSSATTFPLNQKWVYSKYGIYVQKVIPIYYTKNVRGQRIAHGLFADTFTPDRFLYQNERSNVKRTIHYTPVSLKEFLQRHENENRSL